MYEVGDRVRVVSGVYGGEVGTVVAVRGTDYRVRVGQATVLIGCRGLLHAYEEV